MVEITVIVPIYNSERFLIRCIDSILSQSFTNLELILVDDGSSDASGKICDDYARKDTRVRVFHKENGGVSSARNLGITNACGAWMTFVDADDYIEPLFLEILMNYTFYDFVVGGATYVDMKGNIIKEDFICETKIRDRNDFKKKFANINETSILDAPWHKLFKTSIIKTENLKFDLSLFYGEDKLFVLEYLRHINSMIVLKSLNYNYRLAEDKKYVFSWEYELEWCGKILKTLESLYKEKDLHDFYKQETWIKRFCAHHTFLCCEKILQEDNSLRSKLHNIRKVMVKLNSTGRIDYSSCRTKKEKLISLISWFIH